MNEPLSHERLQLLEQHLSELKAHAEQLADKPRLLREQIHYCERAGDLGGADEAEAELATLLGVIAAAKVRAEIVGQIFEKARAERERWDIERESERIQEWNRGWSDRPRREPTPEELAVQEEQRRERERLERLRAKYVNAMSENPAIAAVAAIRNTL